MDDTERAERATLAEFWVAEAQRELAKATELLDDDALSATLDRLVVAQIDLRRAEDIIKTGRAA